MSTYAWAVIGAGPAGIAAVGRLLDHGVAPTQIAWLDPDFTAGDLGGKWREVPSNTVASLFLDYLNASPSFQFAAAPPFELTAIDPQLTCPLGLVADALVWISDHLRRRVVPIRGIATALRLQNRAWTIEIGDDQITATNVVLAVGATPRTLDYPGLQEIPLEIALSPSRLAHESLDGATVAVFGASHSAMIALPNLLALPVRKVINIYRHPLRYAVDLGDWTLFDDVGLKGQAAQWARENIDGVHPPRLERYYLHHDETAARLAECDHVVYTVGLQRRPLPALPQWDRLDYDPTTGIIAPGLFGFGVAFPEYHVDPTGFGQHRVGLYKFMQYLDAVLPIWLNYRP
ncbi:MAG: FAD-dependent oxidoreductase [Mycobacterium sp.]